jgi:hypothetical protein
MDSVCPCGEAWLGKVRLGHGQPKPLSDEIVNERPLRNAEHNDKAATSEYDTNIADREKEAQTNEANARADALKHPQVGKTPDEQTFNDLLTGENGSPRINPATTKPYTPFEAFTAVSQAKQDVKAPSAEEDKRQYGTLLNKQRNGTISPAEERQLGELTIIYPQLAPMGEAAAGQANARIVDSLAQNPSTKKKIASGQVPDEYRILPTDTREEAKDKEARGSHEYDAGVERRQQGPRHCHARFEAVFRPHPGRGSRSVLRRSVSQFR